MKVIGITGGIGSGKTQVTEYLHDKYGATICTADDISRKLQKKGKACYEEIVKHFGQDILQASGEINRSVLADIVFNDEKKLELLNSIVHPAVKIAVKDKIKKEERKNTNCFFLEAALLLEEHYEEICDEMWFIYVTSDIRMKRLKYARGYTSTKVNEIMKNQAPDEQFFKACDRVIDNNKTFLETCYQLDSIMKEL